VPEVPEEEADYKPPVNPPVCKWRLNAMFMYECRTCGVKDGTPCPNAPEFDLAAYITEHGGYI